MTIMAQGSFFRGPFFHGPFFGGPFFAGTAFSPLYAAGIAALIAAIFVFDSMTDVEIAGGVMYVAVVMMAVRCFEPRGVVLVAGVCIALTAISHFLSPGDEWETAAIVNRTLGMSATAVTALLALRNQASEMALRVAQQELARVNRVSTLGELLAGIAHEVNQPLAAVVTNAGAGLRWLAGQPPNPAPNLLEARQAFERIVADGNRASAVVVRVRALVNKAPARRDWLDINDVIAEVMALTRGEIVRHRIALQTELAAGLPPVQGDRIQLQQVILNLVVNAIEVMAVADEAPRELAITSQNVPATGVCVTVQDTGAGLDAGGVERIFDPFYTTKRDGMGMGLAISRSIVAAHGGRLWATPVEPHGARFAFTLPVETRPKGRTALARRSA
jgi:C4-dicarboxylate-specific signal transduction histidine kinase